MIPRHNLFSPYVIEREQCKKYASLTQNSSIRILRYLLLFLGIMNQLKLSTGLDRNLRPD